MYADVWQCVLVYVLVLRQLSWTDSIVFHIDTTVKGFSCYGRYARLSILHNVYQSGSNVMRIAAHAAAAAFLLVSEMVSLLCRAAMVGYVILAYVEYNQELRKAATLIYSRLQQQQGIGL